MTNHPNRSNRVSPPPVDSTAEEDRDELCVEALAPHYSRLMTKARAAGWSDPELLTAMLSLCVSDMRAGAGDRALRETLSQIIFQLDE